MSEVFYGYWYDGELPPYARLSINSYVKNGHNFVLYTHGRIPNAPSGCILADAHKYITEEETQPFLQANRNLRMLSDWMRYRLMYDRGGWWADVDTVIIPGIPIPKDEYVFFRYSDGTNMASCLFKVPPKAPLMAKLERCFSHPGEKRPWCALGYFSYGTERRIKGKSLTPEVINIGALHMFGGPAWMEYAVCSEKLQQYIHIIAEETRPEYNGFMVAFKEVEKIFNGTLSYEKDIAGKGWNLHLFAWAMGKRNLWNRRSENSVASELIRMYGLD